VSWLSRIFLGDGELPAALRGQLEVEGILLLEEGVRGSVTYRGYRTPHMHARFRRIPRVVFVAVTGHRLLVAERGVAVIDVGWQQRQVGSLDVSARAGQLVIAYEISAFHADRVGRIEVELRPAEPELVRALIQERRQYRDPF
jgi:hypothetical protein